MGLIGGMARTAVVAGTATAVSNRGSRRQAGRGVEGGLEGGMARSGGGGGPGARGVERGVATTGGRVADAGRRPGVPGAAVRPAAAAAAAVRSAPPGARPRRIGGPELGRP